MPKQQKSFNTWFITIGSGCTSMSDDLDALSDTLYTLLLELSEDVNIVTIVAGQEVGTKAHKIHWHIALRLQPVLMWSDSTVRRRFSFIKEDLGYDVAISGGRETWEKILRYATKDDVFFTYGVTPEYLEEQRQIWKKDGEEYKKTKKTSKGLTIVGSIYKEMKDKNLDVSNVREVASYVVDTYERKDKSFNSFQVTSIVRGIMLKDKVFKAEMIENIIQNVYR